MMKSATENVKPDVLGQEDLPPCISLYLQAYIIVDTFNDLFFLLVIIELFFARCFRFVTVHAFDRQTDRQGDRCS